MGIEMAHWERMQMVTRGKAKVAQAAVVALMAWPLAGCFGGVDGTVSTTKWLSVCSADTDCAGGLSCLCGTCSRECDVDEACAGLDGEAVCVVGARASAGGCGSISMRTCERGCASDVECEVAGQGCVDGVCSVVVDESSGTAGGASTSGQEITGQPGGPDPSPVAALCTRYCEMEAECLNPPPANAGCQEACEPWAAQYTECGFEAWASCISEATCDEGWRFLDAHPVGVSTATPCGDEYLAMDCMEFQPIPPGRNFP